MNALVKLLGKTETTILIALLVVALLVLAYLRLPVPPLLEWVTTALVAGNLYATPPPAAEPAAPAPAENGDAEGDAGGSA